MIPPVDDLKPTPEDHKRAPLLYNLLCELFNSEYQVSCEMDDVDDQFIVRVFMIPKSKQDEAIEFVRGLEKKFLADTIYTVSVIAYTPEETKQHYPEYYTGDEDV